MMREAITWAQRSSKAISDHSEAIRGSSTISGRQSSEVRQRSPGGSHQRFVNDLREAVIRGSSTISGRRA